MVGRSTRTAGIGYRLPLNKLMLLLLVASWRMRQVRQMAASNNTGSMSRHQQQRVEGVCLAAEQPWVRRCKGKGRLRRTAFSPAGKCCVRAAGGWRRLPSSADQSTFYAAILPAHWRAPFAQWRVACAAFVLTISP